MEKISKVHAKKMLAKKQIDSDLFGKGFTALMPAADAKRWLKALRDGTFIQSSGTLHDANTGGFCCLGVEQYANNKCFVEYEGAHFLGYPTFDYHKERGYLYVNSTNDISNDLYVKSLNRFVSEINDEKKFITVGNQHGSKEKKVPAHNFTQIADWIEESLLVY